jgi:hypothetical protein
MKKNYSFYSILTAIPIGLLCLVSFTGGQGGNFSGSPGDGGTTCTQCHAPGANHGGTVALSNVPTAYEAGQTYNLNLDITGSSVSKFGFNITAETPGGNKVGTWTASADTRLRTDMAGLTHNPANSTGSWAFSWTAPPPSTTGVIPEPVTFYYATIQANNANGNGGDQMVSGQSNAVLTNNEEQISSFKLFPTHATNNVTIELAHSEQAKLFVYNINGQPVIQHNLARQNQINVSSLAAGVYISQVVVDNKISTQKFIKK